MPQKRQPSIWDEVDQAIAPAAPAAAAPSVWDDVDQALASAPPTIGQRQFPKGANAGGTTTAVPAPFSMSGPDAIPVGPQSVLDRLGHRPEPLNPPPSMLDIVKGTAFKAAQQIPRTPQQVGPAAMKAVSSGMEALSGAATAIPTAIGETIANQPMPGHQGEPDTFLWRLGEHAKMILGGEGGQVTPIGIVKATVNPPDSYAPPALGFKGSASMQSPVRSRGESLALETGRRGMDMVARLVSDPSAVAVVGLPGVAGQALGLFFTAQGVQAAAETAANPKATPEDVAESLVNAAVLTAPLALHAAVPRLRAAIRAGGDWGRARQMESVPWAPGQGPRAAERALTPEVPELPAVGEPGIPSPTGSSPVGAPSAPIPVTPRAPEPSPVWDAVDQAIAQTPTPPADQGPPIVLPPVAVRPGGTAGAPVAPSPELPPVVPSAEPSPVWQAVDEAIAQPTDTSGRELGGYAGPERRTENRVSSPEEDQRYTRMREKLAAGEPTGTEEARSDFEERQRVEEARRQGAIDEIKAMEPKPVSEMTDKELGNEFSDHAVKLGDRNRSDYKERLTRQRQVSAEITKRFNAAKESAAMEPKPDREFSSTQIELPQEHADALRALAAKIPDEHLAEDGREDHPHVTVKFGLHTNDAEDVRKVLADEPPIKVRLGKTSLFPAKEGADYDVVKADVDSPDLHRLNAKIAAALEHTDTHPEYKPHATLAYVKPGLGKQYEGDASLQGREATISAITFSGKDRTETTIPLSGKAKAETSAELSDQDRSYQEWRENAGRVAANPEAASDKDLRRALGYLSHKRVSLRHNAEKNGLPIPASLIDSVVAEEQYYTRLLSERNKPSAPPDVWKAVDEAIAPTPPQQAAPVGKFADLSKHEQRELRRIHQELESYGYEGRTRTVVSGGAKGKEEIWTAGHGGAPVFGDIQDGRSGKRADVQRALANYIKGGKPSKVAERAVEIARRRMAGDVHLSPAILPMEAGESGVPPDAGAEAIRARSNARVADKSDLEFLVRRYDEHREFGNVVSRDNAKDLLHGGSRDARTLHNDAVSDAAGVIADAVLKKRLAEPAGSEARVVLTSGGTGSGKTTVGTKSEEAKLADITYDSQATDLKAAKARIEQVLKSGREAARVYVYRDPVDAWINGVLPRADESGRPVSIEGHLASHRDALKTAIALSEQFADNPRVSLKVIDNTGEQANQVPSPVQFLTDRLEAYNEADVRRTLRDVTDSVREELGPALYEALTGGVQPEAGRGRGEGARGRSGGAQEQSPQATPQSKDDRGAEEAQGVAPPTAESSYISKTENNRALRATYGDGDDRLSSREVPQSVPVPPVGSWRLDDTTGRSLDGREIDQLVEINVENIEISEDTGPQKWADVQRYAEWTLAGKEAPPINVVQTDRGTLKTMDHRRLLAAKAAGLDTIKAWVSWATHSDRPGSPIVGLTFELAQRGKRPSIPVSAARPEHTIFSGDKKALDRIRASLQKVDTLDTGEKQARLPGAESARQAGKASTSFKAPQQASGEDFALGPIETPEATARREAAEKPSLFVESAEQTKPSSGQDILAKMKADTAARRARMTELQERFERDGYLYAENPKRPGHTIVLSPSTRQGVKYQVTTFDDGQPTGHRDYNSLGVEKGPLDSALSEFLSWDVKERPTSSTEKIVLPVTPRSESASVEIPSTRPYLTADMKPSEMMRAYVKATWGEFGQQDLIDAVVGATGFKNFVPGKSTRRGDKATLSEQKRNVLKWMDWSDAGIAEHEKSTSALPVTPKASEPDRRPSTIPVTPKNDPKREALIERIVAAARRPEPDIVPVVMTKGTDGKWYRATANSMPQNVRATDEDRIDGYVIRTEQGTTVGTAAPTKEAKLKEWQAVEEKKAADFRTHLQGESDERLQSQASYWLKTGAKPGLAGHDDFIARLRKGEVTPHDLKTAFEQALSDKAKLLEQLSAMTKDELLKRFGRMGAARYKSEKKAAIVDAAYRDILQDFVLANSLSYNPMSKGGFEAAVRAQVENATEADIAAYAQRVTEAIDAHKKRVEGYVKAIKNPETLEEFDTFVRANKNGEAGLTDAQRVTYDELRARAGREVRQRDDAKKATVQAASETVATTITETTHTKKGYPLFVVQLAKRVERDDYTKLNLAAKKLGGWYSSFRGNGATPGFQFKTKDAAEAFQKLATEGDTTAVKEAATERRETRREEKKNAAAERLADMADKLEASAQESLSRDRLANTARRARMAESADASARADLAMARTLRNLAEAIESGEATHLDGIRTKTQIEGLDKIATQAKYDAIRERSPEYRDFEKEKDRAVTAADIDHATYPAVTATRADLLSAATAFKGRRVATRLTALAKRTSGDERIEVPWDVVAEAVAVDEELGKRGVLPWIWASRQTDHRRLETAGIPDLPTLRAALREFVQYRGAKPEADKVKTLERELAGERGVGIDFFPTPEDLALRMAEALDVQKGMTVLEPSAGKGNLADAVRAVNSDAVIHVVEIAPKLRAILEAKGYHIAGQDFTGFAGEQDREERYDRVIMNPPFSNGQDADHVRRAFDLLKPGGRLVAITGEGIFFRGDKKATAFRAWFDEVGGTSEKLEGAFTDRREVKTTGVASRLLVVNKPEAPAKSEKGGSGNVSAESFRSPTRRPFTEPPRSPIPVTARKPVRPSDLVKRVSDLFGKLPIKTKRFRERAFGIYKKKEQVVRLKVENDLATLSHELGHHVDLAIFGNDLPYDLYRDELLRLGANTSRGRDSAETKLREGAAEFFRLYVSDPNGARRQAPTYYRAFTDALAKSEWADAIKETQKLFRDYLGQDLATRGEARIDFTGGQPDTLFKQIASDPRGFVDRMATAWVDDLRAAQRVVEALEKDSGEPIDALESAYVLARLARGAAGKAEGFLHYGPRSKDGTFLSGSLHDALEPVAKRLEDFSRFLVALRVVELRGRGIETGISFPEAKAILDRSVAPGYVPAVAALEATRAGEKTGLTLEQAEAAVQSHIKTGFKEFEKARVAVYAYQDAVLRYARELGALSGDQIKAIRAVNRFYVPFQRVLEATESGLTGTAKRLADRALPVKRIRGSGKDIINPLESIIKNTFATVDMVEKNRAMLALVDQAMEIKGSGRFIEHIPAPQVATQFNLSQVAGAIKKALEEEGVDLSEVLPNGGQLELDELVTVFTPAQFAGKGSGIVSVIRNGKREWYSVNDKDLYDAITAVGPQIAGWVKALSGPASWLRAGATLTLGFVARNPVRDTFVAAVQSKHGFVPVVDTVRGLFSYLKADNYYQDFLNSGAANSALVSRDRDQIRTALRKMVDRKWIPRNPIEILRALSEATEMATRVGEFRRGVLHEGRTPEGKARAALGARDVTMDFARAGSVGRQVNQFAAFFNARVQGYSRMVDLAKEDAHRARTEKDPNPFHYASGRAAIYLALFSALVWKLNQDDRDYEEIPDWEKATYWHIPIPGGWIRVPKPFEWGTIFGSTTEAALNYLKTKDPQKLRNLFPDGPGPTLRAAALSIMPVAIMPWVEIWSNYDMFRDRNIVSPYDTDLPPELQYSRWTSTTAKTIGNVMGVSPSKIDHIAYGYFAGLGRAAMEAPSVLTRLSGQSSAPAGGASDLPVVGTFFRPRALSAQATSLQDLYDFSERLSGAKRGMELYAKRGDYEQVKEIRQTLGPIVAGRPSLDVAARSINEGVRELKELRPQIDAIFASKTLTPQQKREQLDRVYEAMVQTARMALGRPPLERRQTAGAGR